jgi:hypothetical protein
MEKIPLDWGSGRHVTSIKYRRYYISVTGKSNSILLNCNQFVTVTAQLLSICNCNCSVIFLSYCCVKCIEALLFFLLLATAILNVTKSLIVTTKSNELVAEALLRYILSLECVCVHFRIPVPVLILVHARVHCLLSAVHCPVSTFTCFSCHSKVKK